MKHSSVPALDVLDTMATANPALEGLASCQPVAGSYSGTGSNFLFMSLLSSELTQSRLGCMSAPG